MKRTSRRSYTDAGTDYSRILNALTKAGVGIRGAGHYRWRAGDEEIPPSARAVIALETTSFFFDASGDFIGHSYMARDECDYFAPREVSTP